MKSVCVWKNSNSLWICGTLIHWLRTPYVTIIPCVPRTFSARCVDTVRPIQKHSKINCIKLLAQWLHTYNCQTKNHQFDSYTYLGSFFGKYGVCGSCGHLASKIFWLFFVLIRKAQTIWFNLWVSLWMKMAFNPKSTDLHAWNIYVDGATFAGISICTLWNHLNKALIVVLIERQQPIAKLVTAHVCTANHINANELEKECDSHLNSCRPFCFFHSTDVHMKSDYWWAFHAKFLSIHTKKAF